MYVVAGVLLVLGVLAAMTVLSRSKARVELEKETLDNLAPTVSVIHPKRVPSRVELELPGRITAYEESPIYARVSGYLKRWLTDIGTEWRRGRRWRR